MNVCRNSPITRSKSHYFAEIGPLSVLSSVSLELKSFGPDSKPLRSLLLHEHPVSKPIRVWGVAFGLQRHTKHPDDLHTSQVMAPAQVNVVQPAGTVTPGCWKGVIRVAVSGYIVLKSSVSYFKSIESCIRAFFCK